MVDLQNSRICTAATLNFAPTSRIENTQGTVLKKLLKKLETTTFE